MDNTRGLHSRAWRRAPAALRRVCKWCYASLPTPWLMGRRFRADFRLLARSQWWPADRVRALQEEKLRRLVAHCYHHVPYYRACFDDRGLRPEDLQHLEDLTKLPLLTKDLVREHAQSLCADNLDRWCATPARSGGSTGNPLHFLVGVAAWDIEWASQWRFFQWAGYRFGDRCMLLRGVTRAQSASRWYFEPKAKQLSFTGSELSEPVLADIVHMLERYRPRAVIGYPSVLDLTARYLRSLGRHEVQVPAVITLSETLYPATRELVAEQFRAQVFDWYGLGEHVAFAAQCERGRYHVGAEYTVMEYVDAAGQPVTEGEAAIVGTCLDNYAMPFLRYRTDDVAVVDDAVCPCGRGLPSLQGVAGRQGDFVSTPSGRLVGPSILYQCFLDLRTIRGAQLVQEAVDRVVVRVVPGAGYHSQEGHRAVEAVRRELGEGVQVTLEEIAALPATEHGKHRLVVSRVSNPLAAAGVR